MRKLKYNLYHFYRGFSFHSSNHLIMLVIAFVFINILTLNSSIVETYYSRFFFKYISAAINAISFIFPISIAQILLLVFIVLVLRAIIRFATHCKIFYKNILLAIFLGKVSYKLMCFALYVYIIFMLLWGLNYYRVPLSSYLEEVEVSNESVTVVVKKIIDEANLARASITDDRQSYSIAEFIALAKTADDIFIPVYEEFAFLKGFIYSPPKPILLSKLFLYTQITGIYSPFTSEANVNYKIPYSTLPFTMTHEMAHQRGIAYEDEANFIAYIANSKSDNAHIRYSAMLTALLYCLSALNKDEEYKMIIESIDEQVLEDIKYISQFWANYRGVISDFSNTVNDTYLKANAQKEGVKSYSKVVDLIVRYEYSKK